ncbi:MAG: hypothetical protein EXS37_14095 [Opitutus sp.]|nr:hypothetical protein [Opitutus sp.]
MLATVRFPILNLKPQGLTLFSVPADSGATYPIDPPRCEPRLPYPRPRDEPLRYRSAMMETGETFDQTGFELPPAPEAAPDAAGQGQLFSDDYSQPDAADGEPVFWSDSAGPPFPADDFVQADGPEAV